MNKLVVVEDNININPGEYFLDLERNSHLNISSQTILHNYDLANYNLDININDESNLTFYQFLNLTHDTTLNITINNSSVLNLNLLIVNSKDHTFTLNIHVSGNNSKAVLNIHALNNEDDSHLNLICNGYIKKGINDATLVENIKGLITSNDSIKVSPNMFVDSYNVTANHLVTIGSFDPNILFYLCSRNLTLESAKSLIITAFKNSILSPELKKYNGGDLIA